MVSLLQLDELTWTESMAIFGNFKGTTQSDFTIGKNDTGSKISTGTQPSSDISNGDLYIDSSNSTLQVYNGNWVSVGSTLTDLNVDSGTLYVDSSNDTVSVGSTSSNEKLFVNGSLRLGTNPTIKFSGAYLDVAHSNGTATQLRVRDNSSGSDPIFKVFNASNSAEVFKVEGNEVLYSDNVKAKFGTAGDLEIYHDGSNSYIDDAGTGSLKVRSGTVTISNAAGSKTSAVFNSGGSQDLYHNNNKKFETTNSGISVTGDVAISGDITGADTDNLSEGTTNVYFTTARANSAIDAKLTGDLTFGNVTAQSVETGVVEGVVFQPITDYGSITSSANITIDYGAVNETGTVPAIGDFEYISDIFGPTGDSFVVASLPSAAQPGQMIYVSDETSGSVMAFSDGTNWRRITDRAIVS
tara:strand:+ start:4329 stop:5564 length:1236 start_codon:yes stop_codon:yes gene_type:complete